MKAIAFAFHSDTVDIVETECPVPRENEVQVKVEYSALDTAFDAVLHRTWTGFFVHKFIKPLHLGWHFSGIVTAIGTSASKEDPGPFEVGDAVFGHLPYSPNTTMGALAEYVTIPVTECAKRPSNLDGKIAAASTTEALTALQALRDYGGLQFLQRDDNASKEKTSSSSQPSVLIVGAGGGVGSAAVQIARIMGAHVTAVCSQRDVERVRDEYRADRVLSRDEYPDPLDFEARYDVIFDTPVALSSARALQRLKKDGHYVTTLPSWGFLWGMMVGVFRKKGVHMVEVHSRTKDLETVADWITQGKLSIPIDSTFKVKDTTKALQRQRERKKGRVAIQVENGWE